MSSDIKNDLLNLQKYLIVGETSSSSTKVAKEMRNKYQKKNRSPIKLRLGNFEQINPFAPEPPVTARADPGPFYPL